MTYRCFAVAAPSVEEITRAELAGLGFQPLAPQADDSAGPGESGGVEFDARPAELYRANLQLRTASRILVRVGEFDVIGFDELRRKASRLGWKEFLRPGERVSIRVSCHKSRLYHSSAVARETAAAISAGLKSKVTLVPFTEHASAQEVEDAILPRLILVRIVHDHATFSIDASGELLHRRGYRLQTAKAPLRETLAAALLLASGWDTRAPLLDPFCGSGTIPIEAALLAGNIAPGKNRHFACMDWPNFKNILWEEQLQAALAAEKHDFPLLYGSDRDAGAVQISAENAARAGVGNRIQWHCQAFSAVEPPEQPGWLITNPPYGQRISTGADLRNLYTRLGDVLRGFFPGWHYGYLCADPILAGHTRLQPRRTLTLVNGGLPVKYYLGEIPALGE